MTGLNRRAFLATGLAAGAVRVVPQIASRPQGRWVLKLVYDKSLGAMRAIEKWVP